MPTVNLPDGTKINFPDGIPESEMLSAIQSLNPKESQANQPSQLELPFGQRALKGADDFMRSVASGATFGFADEIAAKMNELTGRGTYPENVKAERERDKGISPMVSIPGEITGSVLTGLAAGPVMAGTKTAQAFSRLPKWIQATGLGGLFGGAFGAGHAEEGERLGGAATGAPLGAATGALAYPLIRGAEAALGGAARGIQAMRDPEKAAIRKVAEAMNLDETTAARVQTRLKTLGPQGMIADAGGENVLGTLRGAAGMPGVAKNRVMQALEGRAEGEGQRIAQAVKRGLDPQDYFAAEETMLGKLKDNAAQLYQEAYKANPSVMTPGLERILKNPRVQDGIRAAARMAENERAAGSAKWLGPVDKELTELARETGAGGRVAKGLSLETWQHVKEGVDSLLKSPKYSNELTGKLNPEGRSLEILRQAVVKELDKATGGEKSLYAMARKQYAGDAEVLSALRDGKDFMKLAPEQIRKEISGMSDAAKESYRSGAARAVMDIVQGTQDQASAARKLFGKAITREKISAIFPDQGSANEFARRMISEQRFAKTKNYVGSGSRTAPMLAEQQDLQNAAGSLGAVVGSNIPGVHPLVASGLGRRLMQKAFPPNQETNQAIARILTTRNPAERLFYLDQLKGLRAGVPPSPTVDPWTASMIMGLTGQEGRLIGQNQRP